MKKEELNQYFTEIKTLFPIYSKKEKRFLADFKESVAVFLEENPDSSMEDILNRFASPEEVVLTYIREAYDSHELCKKLRFRKAVKRILIVLLIAMLAYYLVNFLILSHAASEAESHYIDREITVIE